MKYCYIAGVFYRYSASFHWLVHGHMTSNNETVSRQMPWVGNIAKAMTSNGKQFTVTRSTVHCWPLLHVMTGISARFSNFAFVLFCNITNHLMTGPLGNSGFCFPRISMFDFVSGNIEILGKQNSLFPSGPVIKCLTLHDRSDSNVVTDSQKARCSVIVLWTHLFSGIRSVRLEGKWMWLFVTHYFAAVFLTANNAVLPQNYAMPHPLLPI